MNEIAPRLRSLEIAQRATFEKRPGGLTRIVVNTPLAQAHVYLHGAHLSHFQPAGHAPLLWMSAASHFAPGKPIRGGVPVIFPWFGPRAGHPESPAHGFARTSEWEIESLSCEAEVIFIVLRLESSEATRALWPHDFVLRHRIRIGAQLEMALETHNPSQETWNFEEALHTYFTVSDARQVSVSGLAGVEYLDKVDAGARKTQGPEPLEITAETDRLYVHTQSACVLEDPGLDRRITVGKDGSDTTVIWNPWIAKSRTMADFGDSEWPAMICIETCNAGENALTLAPGQTHTMRAIVSAAR
jgi:glucose-6-phosphate 1-epimerase